MPGVRKLRISNPHRRRRRNRKKNVSEVLIMANPRRRRSRNSRRRSHRRKSNPFFGKKRHSFRRHRRSRNPVAGFSAVELAKLAGGAAVGVLGSTYLSQMVLGSNNVGATGALGQGAATLVIAYVANKFGAGKDITTGIAAGGIGATLLNLLNQYLGIGGGGVSGLGNPAGAAMLGEYNSAVINQPWGLSAPAAPAPAPSKGQQKFRMRG